MIDRHDCLITGIVMAGVSIPLVLGKIPPNGFYGFRTPRTLAEPALWYRANWFAGWALLVAGVVIGLIATMLPPGALDDQGAGFLVIIMPLLVAVALSFGYVGRL